MEALIQELHTFKSIIEIRRDMQKNLILARYQVNHPGACKEAKELEAFVNRYATSIILIPVQERLAFEAQ